MKFNHVGIPTSGSFDGEIPLPHLPALHGHRVIIEPNSPSRGVIVAFVEVNGVPVEPLQIDHEARPDL